MVASLQNLWNPQKLPEKMVERDRYFQGQLNLMSTKLERLEKVVSVGLPLSEAEDTMERLDAMEKGIRVTSAKSKIYGTILKDLTKDMASVKKEVDEKGNIKQLMLLNERLKNVEAMYETFSSNKTKDVFMNIVDILKNLEGRLKTLEEVAHSNASLMFESKVKELRGTVQEEEEKGLERVKVPASQRSDKFQPTVEGYQPGASPHGVPGSPMPHAPTEQSLKEKIVDFWNKLIGKS